VIHPPDFPLVKKLTAIYYKPQKKATALQLIGKNISDPIT
jgi:hypothetical protein